MPRKPSRNISEGLLGRGLHTLDIKKDVARSILLFLEHKRDHLDRPISKEVLLVDAHVRLVRMTPFDDHTFEFIHNNCLARLQPPKEIKHGAVPWTVQYLIGLIEELKFLGIAKDFQPGLILLYFKFCKGFDIKPLS